MANVSDTTFLKYYIFLNYFMEPRSKENEYLIAKCFGLDWLHYFTNIVSSFETILKAKHSFIIGLDLMSWIHGNTEHLNDCFNSDTRCWGLSETLVSTHFFVWTCLGFHRHLPSYPDLYNRLDQSQFFCCSFSVYWLLKLLNFRCLQMLNFCF